MLSDTHVYLGPSLDLAIAITILPNAHYHPPIECGDIIRVLRLEPKKIIIIDGLYESVPAVWHKEILLALELGIEVWGAASMGALRAAELYQYGMRGYGVVFNDFKTEVLCDDDEVAVLHHHQGEHYKSINDAMVNIRATCEQAWSKAIISLEEKYRLIEYCKSKFFPYRSLQQAVSDLNLENGQAMSEWLHKNGMVDVKKIDAIGVLEFHRDQPLLENNAPIRIPVNQFLKELTYYANLTPFKYSTDWLPPIERQLQHLYKDSPHVYMLMAELAHFTQKLFCLTREKTKHIDSEALLAYIKQHSLYSPESDFVSYKKHPKLSSVYTLICQFVCLEHFTCLHIDQYVPVIAHYYGFNQDQTVECESILRKLLILFLATNQHTNKPELTVSSTTVSHYLGKVMHYRKYDSDAFKSWFYPTHIERQLFTNFLLVYIKMAFFMYSDNAESRHYFQWIYDAYSLCATPNHVEHLLEKNISTTI